MGPGGFTTRIVVFFLWAQRVALVVTAASPGWQGPARRRMRRRRRRHGGYFLFVYSVYSADCAALLPGMVACVGRTLLRATTTKLVPAAARRHQSLGWCGRLCRRAGWPRAATASRRLLRWSGAAGFIVIVMKTSVELIGAVVDRTVEEPTPSNCVA